MKLLGENSRFIKALLMCTIVTSSIFGKVDKGLVMDNVKSENTSSLYNNFGHNRHNNIYLFSMVKKHDYDFVLSAQKASTSLMVRIVDRLRKHVKLTLSRLSLKFTSVIVALKKIKVYNLAKARVANFKGNPTARQYYFHNKSAQVKTRSRVESFGGFQVIPKLLNLSLRRISSFLKKYSSSSTVYNPTVFLESFLGGYDLLKIKNIHNLSVTWIESAYCLKQQQLLTAKMPVINSDNYCGGHLRTHALKVDQGRVELSQVLLSVNQFGWVDSELLQYLFAIIKSNFVMKISTVTSPYLFNDVSFRASISIS